MLEVVPLCANATEVLDNLLENENKRLLLPLLEDLPHAKMLEYCKDDFELKRQTPGDWLNEFLMYGSDWLAIAASFLVGELADPVYSSQIQKLMAHPHPIVRETALQASQSLLSGEELKEQATKLAHDRHPGVRKLALHLLGNPNLMLTPETT